MILSARVVRSVTIASLALLACAAPTMPVSPSATPSLVIRGGTIHTMDPSRPRAEMAVAEGGRFTCVGSESECAPRVRAGARVVDLRGGAALPGLADAHGHVASLGFAMRNVDLGGARDEGECVARLAERAKTTPPGTWILARGWDQNRWPDKRMPTLGALSRAVADHPVLASRVDGHAVWINARALAAAAITRDTPDPAGGRIVRDSSGAPSGVLVDNAEDLVRSKLPPPSEADVESAIRAAVDRLLALGITSAHDAGCDARTLSVYRRLAERGQLGIHVYAMLDGQQPVELLRAQMVGWSASPRIGRLTVGAVKMYADGALGSRGALLFDPYADDASTSGLAVTPPDDLRARILEVARAGWQPSVHAIGDRAVHEVLSAFVEASKTAPDARPRVEHLQILDARDAALLAQARAIASMQPTHATSDGPWAEDRLGPGSPRAKGAYAWRTVLGAGAPLACGSDFPVESPDPIAGIRSAVLRTWPGGPAGGWMPEQRLTLEEAVRCFTSGAAYAEHAENERGRIQVGYVADAVTFDVDPFAVGADKMGQPTRTVVEGIIAFDAASR